MLPKRRVLARHGLRPWIAFLHGVNASLSFRRASEALPLLDSNYGVAMRIRLLSVLCLLLVTVVTAAFATDFAVIINPANPAKAMTLADLGKMFKGKTATWANGRNVTIILREPTTPAMKFVIEKVM